MIDTILIAVDGSAAARKAVQFGSDLALQYSARIVLLHVLLHQNLAEALRGLSQVERSAGGGLEGLDNALGDVPLDQILAAGRDNGSPPREALEFLAAKIIELSEEIARSKGVTNITTTVEDGDPAKRILEYSEKENADVIVMGARGLSGVEGLLLGSVSQKVGHLAQRTCITVR
jgi:nucleotide-binding universal stress UspA family protein